MHISTRDMARIGYLMLRDGDWFGNQVIDADWIDEIRAVHTPLEKINPKQVRDDGFGYGYMWWIYLGDDPLLKGLYTGMGAYGQYISVIPQLDMVIAHKTKVSTANQQQYEGREEEVSVSLGHYLDIVRAVVSAQRKK